MKRFKVRNKTIRDLISRKIRTNNITTNHRILDVHFFATLKTLSENFDLQYTEKLTSILVDKNRLRILRADRLGVKKNINDGGTFSDHFFAFPTLPVACFLSIPTFGISLVVYFMNCRKKKIIQYYEKELHYLDNKIKKTKNTLYQNGGRFV